MNFCGLYEVKQILNLLYKTMFIFGMNGHMLYTEELDDSSRRKNLLQKLLVIINLLLSMDHSVRSMGISGGILTLSELISFRMLLILSNVTRIHVVSWWLHTILRRLGRCSCRLAIWCFSSLLQMANSLALCISVLVICSFESHLISLHTRFSLWW